MKKYDVVYFVKETTTNEELRYSLRSIEKNFPHNKVWFVGGQPNGLEPDEKLRLVQAGLSKYSNVGSLLIRTLEEEKISEDFWYFNDDFFVMQPIKDLPPIYYKDLYRYIINVENNNGIAASPYTKRLRHTISLLEENGLEVLNYETHTPILINRKKALDVIRKFGRGLAFRSLYGNYYKIGGKDTKDVKVIDTEKEVSEKSILLSTSDRAFKSGRIGEFIKTKFTERSRFEND